MMPIRPSKAEKPSDTLETLPFGRGENNVEWFARARAHLATKFPSKDAASAIFVLLLGGRDTAHVRVRLAQSAARHDLLPSDWSHAVLATPSANYHIPITTERSSRDDARPNFLPLTNGVQTTSLKEFSVRKQFPNVAVIGLASPDLNEANIQKVVSQFELDRSGYDALDALLQWLAFIWSVGSAPNPLVRGIGLPSSAFIEHVSSACGLDLTPAVAGRASSPEAMWQSAKWWQNYHQRENPNAMPCCY